MTKNTIQQFDSQSIVPRVLSLLGVDRSKYYGNFSAEMSREIISLKYVLASGSKGRPDSPLSIIADRLGLSEPLDMSLNKAIEIFDGHILNVDFCVNDVLVFVLPKHKDSQRIASVLATLAAKRLTELDSQADEPAFALIEFDPSKRRKHRVSTIELANADSRDSIYNAFVTALCTNEEIDFQVEMEILELRSVSRSNRRRIKERMKQLGITTLRGQKADVYLRQRSTKAKIDLVKLRNKFPDAYRQCFSEAEVGDYITIKLHRQ